MGELQDLFDQLLEQEISYAHLLARLVAEKIAKTGITLTESEIEKLAGQISKSIRQTQLRLDIYTWNMSENRSFNIALSSDDVDGVRERIEETLDKLPELAAELTEKSAMSIASRVEASAERLGRRRARDRNKYERHITDLWAKPLDLFGSEVEIADELGREVHTKLEELGTLHSSRQSNVLLRLAARGCQVSREIETLLLHGFADGAIARWRTLHEITVTGMLIAGGDEVLAERYLAHHAIESFKGARQYVEIHSSSGAAPIPPEDWARLRSAYDEAVAKYGAAFKSDHGWACDVCRNEKPTFADLEKCAGLVLARPHYKLASHNVHASPSGVFFKLGLIDDEAMLTAGSPLGLDEPLVLAAHSLCILSSQLCRLYQDLDVLVGARTTQLLSMRVQEECERLNVQVDRADGYSESTADGN